MTQERPAVSICIPAYENPEGIKRLLRSVAAQSFRDIEVILTDDSKTDGVENAVKDCGVPVQYHRNVPSLGAVCNWNRAISLARGRYIKIMHHDDWFADENSLQRFVDLLEKDPEADLAFCGSWQVSPDGSRHARGISKEEKKAVSADYRNLYCANVIGAPSAVIVRRDALQRTGAVYDEQLTWLVDSAYYMEILRHNPHFACTSDPLICIGLSAGQLTNSVGEDPQILRREYIYVYRKERLSENPACREKLCTMLASTGLPLRDVPGDLGIGAHAYRTAQRAQRRRRGRQFLDTADYLYGKAADGLNRRFGRLTYVLFYIGLVIEVLAVVIDKSDLSNPWTSQIFRVTFLLFLSRMVTEHFTPKGRVWLFAFLVLSLISYRVSGRNELLRFTVFTAACAGSDPMRSMKTTFALTLSGCGLLAVLSLAHIFGRLYLVQDFGHGEEVRWCLGMGHPNACHCMAAMLVILFLYLYDRKMKPAGYAALFAANAGLFVLTKSNTGFVIAAAAVLLYAHLHYNERIRAGRAVYRAGNAVFAAGLFFSAAAAVVRPDSSPILQLADRALTGRMASLWDTTFYDGTLGTWHMFGSRLNQVYFDMGWLRLIYWYGVIPAAAVLCLVCALLFITGKRKDYAAYILVLLCCLYTVPEAHLVSVYIGRNFVLMLGALYAPLVERGSTAGTAAGLCAERSA